MKLDESSLLERAWEAFRMPLLAGVLIELVGTAGYRILSDGQATYLDCLSRR